MSLAAYRAVWQRSRAKGAAHHALRVFAKYADDAGSCWPSAATVAAKLQIDERSARRKIAALVADGELIPMGRRSRGVVVYRIACCDVDYIARPPLTKMSGVTSDKNVTSQKRPGTFLSPPLLTEMSGAPLTGMSPEPLSEPLYEPPGAAAAQQAAIELFNSLADELGLRPVQRLTANRRSQLAARLAEVGGLDGWRAALAKIRETPGLQGQNDRGWRVSFDWVIAESTSTKLWRIAMPSGESANGAGRADHDRRKGGAFADVLAGLAEAACRAGDDQQ